MDKNASIDQVLKEDIVQQHIHQQLELGPRGNIIKGYTEADIERAVIDKLNQEEETNDIQKMIAKFYNKFDELHEQSIV